MQPPRLPPSLQMLECQGCPIISPNQLARLQNASLSGRATPKNTSIPHWFLSVPFIESQDLYSHLGWFLKEKLSCFHSITISSPLQCRLRAV